MAANREEPQRLRRFFVTGTATTGRLRSTGCFCGPRRGALFLRYYAIPPLSGEGAPPGLQGLDTA
jgi:hypothetical protein